MSTEYTDESYSGAGTESTETNETTTDNTNSTEKYEERSNVNEDGEEDTEEQKASGGEEEEKKEPEPEPEPVPEPEPDPLEGLTYEDDPEAPLPAYGESAYWEMRYSEDPEPFEWYQDSEALLPAVKDYIDAEKKILIVGNGTSQMPGFLQRNGYENVTAVDFVPLVIKKLRKLYKENENMVFRVMDVRNMKFENGEFQAVVDKGTLDCVYHLGDSEVLQMMAEVSRVLKRRGVFMCVSSAPPAFRKHFFDRPADLLIELEKVIELKKPLPSEQPHYLYIVRKSSKLLT